ncbi:MAG TPA: hypothetical protein VGG69_01770 [Rhizomicrobium sp.]
MSSISPRERLSRLVELAAETDLAARRSLVDGLADLLLDWPRSYPASMREPFEALLEKSLGSVETTARVRLADRFVEHTDAPLHLLNLLMFDAAPETKSVILMRNASVVERTSADAPAPGEEAALLATVRKSAPDLLPDIIASRFRIAPEIGAQVLADESGWMLATLCKGARTTRATFSALAVLVRPAATADESYRRMAAYDGVPQDGAEALLAFWRGQAQPPASAAQAA